MARSAALVLCALALCAGLIWLFLQGREQAAHIARLEETAAANARAVERQKKWAADVDEALAGWRSTREAQEKNAAAKRQQREAVRHDESFSSWADGPLPDAAVRLLQTLPAPH
ncbi:hypothetical protein [Desulfovibrio falkowii]|uniref:Uncharacterized protein n=1 Tax=Desulfovibrio falkowii TaxID=3136602 RepID=A0ABQ0EAH0_9BACT